MQGYGIRSRFEKDLSGLVWNTDCKSKTTDGKVSEWPKLGWSPKTRHKKRRQDRAGDRLGVEAQEMRR